MPDYTVNYSDPLKSPITVYEGQTDNTTSLTFNGRNSKNYGENFAENFLHLLENFASPLQPVNPVEGQLWYDTADINDKTLKIYNGNEWNNASNFYRSELPPGSQTLGDIWVNTYTRQLFIYNGVDWTLIGPTFSSVLRTGSYATDIIGSDNIVRPVILNYVDGDVVEIISNDSFQPREVIDGFNLLVPGANLSRKRLRNLDPRFNGVATSAERLQVTLPNFDTVSANNFFRKDIDQTINGTITINNNGGISIGAPLSTFILQRTGIENLIINNSDSGRILFQINKSGINNTILLINGDTQRVGINQFFPTADLDVGGTVNILRELTVNSTSSVALSVMGSTVISKNLTVSGNTTVDGQIFNSNTFTLGTIGGTTAQNILMPTTGSIYSIGSETLPFRRVFSDIVGTTGTIYYGTVFGSATKLASPTTFSISGQVISPEVVFDGSVNGFSKVMVSSLDKSAITSQTSITTASNLDSILIYSTSSNSLGQITKEDFLSESFNGLSPTGSIIVYAGSTAPSDQWLICDGSSYSTTLYSALFSVIGTTFGSDSPGTFRVPSINPISVNNVSVDIYYYIKT
jgi:hypothetical protein